MVILESLLYLLASELSRKGYWCNVIETTQENRGYFNMESKLNKALGMKRSEQRCFYRRLRDKIGKEIGKQPIVGICLAFLVGFVCGGMQWLAATLFISFCVVPFFIWLISEEDTEGDNCGCQKKVEQPTSAES